MNLIARNKKIQNTQEVQTQNTKDENILFLYLNI